MRETIMRCAVFTAMASVWLTGLVVGLLLRLYYRRKKR